MALVLALAGPAAAQAPASGAAKADVEVGIDAANRVSNKGVTNTYNRGWRVGTAYRITGLISVIAAITGDYDSRPDYTANIYTYAGGVRFQSGTNGGRVRPFIEILLGIGQDNGIDAETPNKTNYYPYLTSGVGSDLAVSDRVAVRIRLDFPLLMRYSDMYPGSRVSVGLALSLGGR